METITQEALVELVAQCVDFVPAKQEVPTWTNNHKHIVEKRRAGEDVDNPVRVEWTAHWTICGMSDSAFVESLGGEGELIIWQVASKTKKGVAEQVHERIVLELASTFYEFVDYGFGRDEELADKILKALTEFASKKEGK
ncbi:hypothetical protein UFOVP711_17 [uncultured Caudovirales phage]|uniref:Uncharacterized protein n=1 Tax=uncultured Caudovirales phage TaxID=2100421 RepID=A0A6J5NNT8_9CAUD|nr:hypothetical protein UFOVP711_17 [uncultured Caudovirales phage]